MHFFPPILYNLSANICVLKTAKIDYELSHAYLSVCLPVGTVQLGCHWTDFHEVWYLSIFRKYFEKIQVLLKRDWQEWRVLYMNTSVYLQTYLAEFFVEWEMLQAKLQRKTQTNILWAIFSFSKSHTIHEIMYKNMIQPDRPQMTI
jgi:hypothetical protein